MVYGIQRGLPATADEVYKSIRKRILKMELEPGQKISENKMCEEYGVSRSVIRTVFTRLNQLKLLDVYPQRGTYISMIDLDFISDLLLLRTAVEKEVIYEIFGEIHEENRRLLIEKLEENIEQQKKFSGMSYYCSEFKRLDSEFHKTLIDSVKRFGLMELMADQLVHIARWRNFDVAFDNRLPNLIIEHIAILEAIKANDLLEAQKAMTVHLDTISEISGRAKKQFPQYFI